MCWRAFEKHLFTPKRGTCDGDVPRVFPVCVVLRPAAGIRDHEKSKPTQWEGLSGQMDKWTGGREKTELDAALECCVNHLSQVLCERVTPLYLNYFWWSSATTYSPEYLNRYKFFGATKEDLVEFIIPSH